MMRPIQRAIVMPFLSGVRGAFHSLDRLGEELLLADLPRFGVLGLVFESVEDPLVYVSRCLDARRELNASRRFVSG